MHNRGDILSREELMGYYSKQVRIKDIAKKLGVTTRTILRWNKMHGITKDDIGYHRYGICPVCGVEFRFWRNNHKVYCSNDCWKKILTNPDSSHKKVNKAGGLTRQTYLMRARKEFLKHKNLKWERGWVMHHLDGDITNNNIENLFVFYGHSDHLKYHHLQKKGVARKLKHIVDGIYGIRQ